MRVDEGNYVVVWRAAPSRWLDDLDGPIPAVVPFLLESVDYNGCERGVNSNELRPRMLLGGVLVSWAELVGGSDAAKRASRLRWARQLFAKFAHRAGKRTVDDIIWEIAREARRRHGPLVSARMLYAGRLLSGLAERGGGNLAAARRDHGVSDGTERGAGCAVGHGATMTSVMGDRTVGPQLNRVAEPAGELWRASAGRERINSPTASNPAARNGIARSGIGSTMLAVALLGDIWRILEYADHIDVESACETIVTTYKAMDEADVPPESVEEVDYAYCVALHLLARRKPLREFFWRTASRRVHTPALRERLVRLLDDESLELAALKVSAIPDNTATQVQ